MSLSRKKFLVGFSALSAGIFLLFLTDSCTPTYSRTEFDRAVSRASIDTLGWVSYKGRKKGHDYFQVHKNIGVEILRLPTSESPITEPFPYSVSKEKWRRESFMHLQGLELHQAITEKFGTDPGIKIP